MEDLLVREQALTKDVQHLLKNTDEPIGKLLQTLEAYRQISKQLIFADFESSAAVRETALWRAHSEGKKYFQRALSSFRKQPNDQVVATRQLVKLYSQFIKDSQRFYRQYVHDLNDAFGGIPELQAVAHQVKNYNAGGNSQPVLSPDLRKKVLYSCHQTLIYLGDLSRYRASDKLDKTPDFGPAIGYYGLACTLRPASGLGHHQIAVIALEQRDHLRAIYHLYRAMVVDEPHPNAASNLKLEFDKINASWDRGDLIQKGSPNDPESTKRTLVGWFVRLHSMCVKGEPFRGHDELEGEVVGQLAAELKHRSLGGTLTRMLMVNLASQHIAGEKYQNIQSPQNYSAFFSFLRLNIKTFTTLLRVYHDDLKTVDLSIVDSADDLELATRLTETSRRLVPALRLYTSWLLPMVRLLDGISSEESLRPVLETMWHLYARTLDLIAITFPIWDLDDVPNVEYMLEEDADSVGFLPLMDARTNQIWYDSHTGSYKPRFSDQRVSRATGAVEMLTRVKDFLTSGLFLANDDDDAPIKLRGTRVLHRDAEDPEISPFPPRVQAAQSDTAVDSLTADDLAKPKPLSYAAAAASRPLTATSLPFKPKETASVVSSHSRHDDLTRMVADLVEDDDGNNDSNNPVTPPEQELNSRPEVATRGDVSDSALAGRLPDFTHVPNASYHCQQKPIGTPTLGATPANERTPRHEIPATSLSRNSVSSLWHDTPAQQLPALSTTLQNGVLTSPTQFNSRGHSRVNSAGSIRSRSTQNVSMDMGISDSWSTLAFPNNAVGGIEHHSNVASPLLFGAGGSVWSAKYGSGFRNVTPPNGQGG